MGGYFMVVAIVLIVFASIFGSEMVRGLGNILREKREYKLEELKLKAQMESQILGGSSVVTENMTAEIQALREEVRQLRNEVSQIASKVDTNIIR